MPVVSVTLPDVKQAVERPALFDIIHEVEKITKIDKGTKILFPDDIGFNQVAKNNIDEENDRRAIFSSDRYLFIEVTSDYEEGALGTTAIHQREYGPVFRDDDIDVEIWPIYFITEYTISFKYKTVSKNEAIRWRDDIRARISQMRDTNLHDIKYHFQIPIELWQLISDAYDNKKRLLDNPPTLYEYVRKHSSPRLVITSDMVDKNEAFAISETQTRIIGQFDFSPLPEKLEQDENGSGWICNFNYIFKFDRPALVGCRYPAMVYNRLLPAKYLTWISEQKKDDQKKLLARSHSLSAISHFEITNQLEREVNIYVPYQIPDFDELKTRTHIAGYGNYLSILTEIDENDKMGLFNLKEIDPYEIDPDILRFIIESEYPYITHAYQSVLHIGLYEGEEFKADRMITCDHDLNLKAIMPLDLTKRYRVVFGINIDLTYLRQTAINRLKRYPVAFMKIIQCINESLRDNPDLAILAKKPFVTDIDFTRFFRYVVGYHTKGTEESRNMFQNPPQAEILLKLDSRNQQKTPRRIEPTYRDNPIKNDPVGRYRGHVFEHIRQTFVGFNQVQLSSIITIKRPRL